MKRGYSCGDLVDGLASSGVGRGDVVHVHSALFSLGRLEATPAAEVPARVYEALRTVVGPDGTVTVAASYDDYARFGSPYDNRRSPVDRDQGALSQHVARLPEAVRSYCPLGAIAGVGPLAHEICHQRTGSAYGTGSGWDMLLEQDAKQCFLGVRPGRALSFVTLIQASFGVPYLYNKLYTVPIYEDGVAVHLPVTSAVRYLDPDYRIREDTMPFEAHLCQRGLVSAADVGRGKVYTVGSTQAAFAAGTQKLQEDLYFFCQEPPGFVPGRIPMDGNTGPLISDGARFGSPGKAS